MAWLQGVVQNARARGDALKDRVQQGAAVVRARAQQFEEVIAGNLQTPQGTFTSQELELQLEADARGLFRTAPATEIVQRWVILLRSSPQPTYVQAEMTPTNAVVAPLGEFTFQQVFLKSNALELALDAVARAPELRGHLRSHALPSPEVWPEEKPPPVAFAHAFTLLLQATIGPSEVWMDFFAVLLSSDKGPADEPCHAWLLQLMAGMRRSWESANVTDREREVEALETAARHGLEVACQNEVQPTAGNIAACLSSLAQRGAAVGTAYRAWTLRQSLVEDMTKVVSRHEEFAVTRRESASTVASVAAERIVVLDAEAARLHKGTEELKRNLGAQVEAARAQLSPHETSRQQLERELEEVELTQAELMRQIGQLSERRDTLRKKLGDTARQTDDLRTELHHVEQVFEDKLAAEEQVHCRIQNARALADAVVNLSTGLAAPGKQDSQGRCLSAFPVAEEASRCRERAALAAIDLGEREVARLSIIAQVIDVCCGVSEEREASREAMAKMGVSASTLEADVVGEAEIEQALQDALVEVDRCQPEVESLVGSLADLAKNESGLQETDVRRAAANAEMLQGCLSQVRTGRERLVALVPQDVVLDGDGEYTDATHDGTVDAFLEGTRVDATKNSMATAAATASASASAVKSEAIKMLSRFGVGRSRGETATTPSNMPAATQADDPFLLKDVAEISAVTGEVESSAASETTPVTAASVVVPAASALPAGSEAAVAQASAGTASETTPVAVSPVATSAAPAASPPPAGTEATVAQTPAGATEPSAANTEVFRMDDDDDEEPEQSQRKSTSSSLDPFDPPPREAADPAGDPPSLPAAAPLPPPAEKW